MDAQLLMWQAEIAASNARIESMKAENAGWAARGESPAHPASDFMLEAQTLSEISNAIREYINR